MTTTNFPTSIMVEPTNNCNSHCPLCPTGSGTLQRPKGYMDEKIFQKIACEVQPHGTSLTLWHYGEPFLHPKIFSMIKFAADLGIPVISSTNGYVFYNPSSIDALIESGLSKLIVSLDGSTPEVNSLYRKGVDFNRVISGLEYYASLKAKGISSVKWPKLVIQMILFRHNQNDIQSVQQMADLFKADFVLKTANLNMVPNVNFESYLPEKEEYCRYIWNREIGAWEHYGQFRNQCSFVETGLVINWDGSVNPCCYDYQAEYYLGNVDTQTLSDIWAGGQLDQLRKQIAHNRASIPMCAICGVDRPQRHLS